MRRRCQLRWSGTGPRRVVEAWVNGAGRGLDEEAKQGEAAGHGTGYPDQRHQQQARARSPTHVVTRSTLDGVASGSARYSHWASRGGQAQSVTARWRYVDKVQ